MSGMVDLAVTPSGTGANCPVCGVQVASSESKRDMRQQMIRDELWPGVVVERSPKQIMMEPAGPFVTTLQPCGHEIVGELVRH